MVGYQVVISHGSLHNQCRLGTPRQRAADIYLTCSHCALGNMYQYSPHFSEFDEHTFCL